jgi:hypothetical protein
MQDFLQKNKPPRTDAAETATATNDIAMSDELSVAGME